MNLKQLKFVQSVADTGSFTQAAKRCEVTQPSLSNSIALLEEELGERLFLRSTRKVSITPFGQHLLPYINEVLNAQLSLEHQAHAYLKPEKQLLRIGTSPVINHHLLNLIIEPFRQNNPQIDVVLREMRMLDLYKMLDQDRLDFAFGVANIYKHSYQSSHLYKEPLLYIPSGEVAAKHQGEESIDFMTIAKETFVMVQDTCGLARLIRSLFLSYRAKLDEYSGEAINYQVLCEWAVLGIGAAIIPQSKVIDNLRNCFFINDSSKMGITIDFETCWARDINSSATLQSFSDHLSNVVPGIIAGL